MVSWMHVCPAADPTGEWYQPIFSSSSDGGRTCLNGCGARADADADADTPLCNEYKEPIATVGGRVLMVTRCEAWWMRCAHCGRSRDNLLRDHPLVAGLSCSRPLCGFRLRPAPERWSTKCSFCFMSFDGQCVPLNRYGEALRTPLGDGILDVEDECVEAVKRTAVQSDWNHASQPWQNCLRQAQDENSNNSYFLS